MKSVGRRASAREMEFAAYLLASPTRSSYVGVCAVSELAREIENLNALDDGSPCALVRPWQLAASAKRAALEEAEAIAEHVSRASGFRARLEMLRAFDASDGSSPPPPVAAHYSDLRARALARAAHSSDLRARALDGMTYAMVTVSNPEDSSLSVTVRALVDTGSTDCELRGELIGRLGVQPIGDAVYETASGIQTAAALFRGRVSVAGRDALCLLSPTEASADDEDGEDDDEEDELDRTFGFDQVSDDALLGHDALAALGLAVDCRHRRLLPLSQSDDDREPDPTGVSWRPRE